MAEGDPNNLTQLTVDLLGAYVANNQVQHGDLASLIQSTHAALKGIESPEPPAPQEPEHVPAVSLRKSLASNTHIVSMIDGKPYQTLTRHLSKHGLTPDQYRERYGLPKTYPMIAAAYSERRRAIAEKIGLGRRAKDAPDAAQSTDEAAKSNATSAATSAPKPVGRPAKAAAAPEVVADAKPAKASKSPASAAKAAPSARAKPRATKARPAKAAVASGAPSENAPAPAPAPAKPKTRRATTKSAPASAKA